jgi:signal transduction histidine kinase/CheY-like chemotaxis protein
MAASANPDLTRRHDSPLDAVGSLEPCMRESSFVGMLIVSRHGDVLAANRRMAQMLHAGEPGELTGLTMSGDLLDEVTDWSLWHTALSEGQCLKCSLSLKALSGEVVTLAGDLVRITDASGKPVALAGTFVDQTRVRQLEMAVQASARMEALGSLTGGIAHDVNNLLTVLVGNLYLVGEELRGNSPLFEKIKPARDAARRGADLTRQLLSFARKEPAVAEAVNPARVIDGLSSLLTQVLGKSVTLSCRLEPSAGPVMASAAQLESVIVNLVINARDAIRGSGQITIAVINRALAEREARSLGLPEGDYAQISVTDDGCGIDKHVRDRVFEPFFTTKKDRGGSGLGLSMVRWFAEQSGGTAWVRSKPGKGTVVSVLLPRLSECAGETGAMTMPLSTLPTGSERVLVLAHDEGLRTTIRETLEVLGYGVHLSSTSQEFFDLLHGGSVDLVIVDAETNSKDGLPVEVLLRRARALRQNVPAIVTTNHSASLPQGGDPGASFMLAKPFSLADFAAAVRHTLDGGSHD